MKRKLILSVGVIVCGVVFVQNASSENYSFVGHRAAGMGGANAASVNDSSAQWHNPAAFGFFSREPDPVEGSITNAITNVVLEVTNIPSTNTVSELDGSDTNVVAGAEGFDTNAVSEAEGTPAALAVAEESDQAEESTTNAVADAVAGAEGSETNTVAEAGSMASVLTLLEESDTGMSVTNETYEVTYEVVAAEIIPEKAQVDNGDLGDLGFGWNLIGLGAGYTMTDEMPEYITQIGKIDYESFDGAGLDGTAEAVESLILLSSSLYGLGSNPDNAFYADATAGMNFRIGHIGVGIRTFGEVAGYVDHLDDTNLGVEQLDTEFVAAINAAASQDSGFNLSDYEYKTINPGDLDISDVVAGGSAAEAYMDYQLTNLKNDGTMTQKHVDDSVSMMNKITYDQISSDPDSTSYENNTSTVMARGFGMVEVPVSYGYAFNDNLSIGITAKGMYGTVTGTKARVADGESFETALENLEENTEASFNFGLDLGVLYRMNMLQFGAVAHNINGPKFKGFDDVIEIENGAGEVVDTVPINVPDYKIDPQVTLGAAFIPSERFMIEMSYDLLETGTLLDNYDIQRISFGTELDVWLLALRLGMYNNLAADWQDWIATAGVGLNLYAVRLDVGGAYSIGENVEYEGTDIPEEARFYASVSFEF